MTQLPLSQCVSAVEIAGAHVLDCGGGTVPCGGSLRPGPASPSLTSALMHLPRLSGVPLRLKTERVHYLAADLESADLTPYYAVIRRPMALRSSWPTKYSMF